MDIVLAVSSNHTVNSSSVVLKVQYTVKTSYMCEFGFSATIRIKIKFQNKLLLSNNLRLKITHVNMNVKT